MAVIPAAGNNGIFAVGVSEDFDQVSRPIRRSALLLTTGGGLVIAGVLLLAGLNLRSGRRNERAQRELALLQEKNAAMEALNRKNQELAHHDRLQTIGTLTSSIAHEFNNLLTPIMGYSLLVLEQLPSDAEELYDNVLEIYNSSRKAKEIIARLSDLSRKNTSLTFQYVSPDELVRKVLAVASPARPPHVEVRTDLACRHLWLRGNEIQLSQMLLNLILNAYHAMEPGGGTLTVATRPEGEFLCFQVSDTGSGISPEVLPHIFEPFFTTKERIEPPKNQGSFLSSLKVLKGNIPGICIILFFFFITTAIITRQMFNTYYGNFVLGDANLGNSLLMVMSIAPFFILYFIPKISARFGKKFQLLLGCGIVVIGGVLFLLAGTNGPLNLAASFVVGLGQVLTFSGVWSIIPDTADYGEYINGVHAPGSMYSIANFGLKMGMTLASSLMGIGLTMAGFDETALVQAAGVADGLRIFNAVSLIVPTVCALLCLLPYKLTAEQSGSISAALAQRHSKS